MRTHYFLAIFVAIAMTVVQAQTGTEVIDKDKPRFDRDAPIGRPRPRPTV